MAWQRFDGFLHNRARAKAQRDGASPETVFIFLAEANPADAGLVRRALEEHGVEGELIVIADGEKAIAFIPGYRGQGGPWPSIIDLDLPKKPRARCSGLWREVGNPDTGPRRKYARFIGGDVASAAHEEKPRLITIAKTHHGPMIKS